MALQEIPHDRLQKFIYCVERKFSELSLAVELRANLWKKVGDSEIAKHPHYIYLIEAYKEALSMESEATTAIIKEIRLLLFGELIGEAPLNTQQKPDTQQSTGS